MQRKDRLAQSSRRWRTGIRALIGIGAGFALTLAACGSSKEREAPAAPAAVTHVGSPALWELKDEDTTIYLFGTVHMLKPGINWFEGDIRNAFDRSDELVLEVVEADPAALAALVGKLAVNADGPTISSQLSPEEKVRYLKALAENEIPAAAMERLDPWMVAISLSVAPLARLGFDPNMGVEKTLEKTARAQGKRVSGLETTEQQLRFFDSLPQKVQIEFLNTTVAELANVESEFDRVILSWSQGKPEALAEQLNESMTATPEMAQRLLFDRNATWAEWIERRMEQPGTIFLAVGAGHLAGKGSLIDLLGKRHLTVKRVSETASASN